MIKRQNKFTVSIGLLFVLVGLALLIYQLSNQSADKQSSEQSTLDNTSASLPRTDGKNIIEPPRAIPNFTFPAHTGDDLSLNDLSGRYVLMTFGYTHCPDVCPANLLKFRQIKRLLGDDVSGQVEYVFISVDPERDTPDMLNTYISRYDAEFIALSGDHAVLETLKEPFGLFWELRTGSIPNSTHYIVDHTASSFLLNPEGELIRMYSFTADFNVIEQDIRELLDS
jgi:protein SCO1/2